MADEEDIGLYTLIMRGEKRTYGLRGSETHTLDVLCKTLSDITGYRSEHLKETLLEGMKIRDERIVLPANNIGSTPQFIIKRVS